jgi:predicted adenylyl cyclase CyaB
LPRNVEIKARIDSIESVLPRAQALADGEAQRLVQDDTFFRVPHGRLKLREFGDGSAELIHYQRPDTAQAKLSDYVRAPVPEPSVLREALCRGLGTLGRVQKQRLLLTMGSTRIHLDRVAGLGDFVELEVVLRDGQSEADGASIAEHVMRELGLAAAPRIAGAYVDLAVRA